MSTISRVDLSSFIARQMPDYLGSAFSLLLVSKVWLRGAMPFFEKIFNDYRNLNSPHLNFFLKKTIEVITQPPPVLIGEERYFTLPYARVKYLFQQIVGGMRKLNLGPDFLNKIAIDSNRFGSFEPSFKIPSCYTADIVFVAHFLSGKETRSLIHGEFIGKRRESYWSEIFPILNELKRDALSDLGKYTPRLLLAPELNTVAKTLREEQARSLYVFSVGISDVCLAMKHFLTNTRRAAAIHSWINNNIEQIRKSIGSNFKLNSDTINSAYMHYEQMFALPEEAGNILAHVENLDLSDLNLNSLPSSFSKLTRLRTLNLEGNRFEHFPKCLYELPYLTNINFRNTCLDKLPDLSKYEIPRGDLTNRTPRVYCFEGNPFSGSNAFYYDSAKVKTVSYPLLRDLTNWTNGDVNLPLEKRILKKIACFFALLLTPCIAFVETMARCLAFSIMLFSLPIFFIRYGLEKGWGHFYASSPIRSTARGIWPNIGLFLTAFNLLVKNFTSPTLDFAKAEEQVEACLPKGWDFQGWNVITVRK